MGLKKWWKNEAKPVVKKAHSFTPTGMALNVLKGGSDKDGGTAGLNSSMDSGMAKGRALGESIMSDPDLEKSRAGMKQNMALTGPNKDLINQKASKQVANMRYKGSKMSPQQELEAQRKLSSDIGAQSFMEDRDKAEGLYKMDLDKAKFLGGMSMAGGQMAISQQEQKKGGLSSMFDSLGLSDIF